MDTYGRCEKCGGFIMPHSRFRAGKWITPLWCIDCGSGGKERTPRITLRLGGYHGGPVTVTREINNAGYYSLRFSFSEGSELASFSLPQRQVRLLHNFMHNYFPSKRQEREMDETLFEPREAL